MSSSHHAGSGRLLEKVIVIIGGTSGMGLSAAKACLAAGANVVVSGRDDAALPAAREALAGLPVRFVASDAVEPDSAERVIHIAVDEFGRLDGLYHVAGGSGRKWGDGPLHEISTEGWDLTLQLNLTSVFYSNRAAVRCFLEKKTAGSIVNMTSVLAFSPSPHFFATHAYAAAKAAIIGMTRSAAAYYARNNIRINAVAPAVVETPMAQRAAESPEIRRFIKSKQPLDGGRIGRADDLDGVVIFLLSDESRFMTGQVVPVDGGWSISEGDTGSGHP